MTRTLLAALFVAGATLVSAWGAGQEATQEGGPEVRFCDLIKNPADYDGKVVIVAATYGAGPEFSIFFDGSCKRAPNEEDVIALAEFTEMARGGSSRQLLKKLGKKKGKTDEAEVTIRARFTDGSVRRFGHQACCRFKLTVQQLLKVQAKERSRSR